MYSILYFYGNLQISFSLFDESLTIKSDTLPLKDLQMNPKVRTISQNVTFQIGRNINPHDSMITVKFVCKSIKY